MGKATIKGPLGGGEYLVDINLDSGFVDSQVTFIPDKIAAFEVRRAEVTAELDELLLFHPEKTAEIKILKNRLLFIALQISQLNIIYRRYSAIDTAIEARMWCADYTLDLTAGTVVGTADIPNQRQQQNIVAGFEGNAIYSGARDGISRPALASGPGNLYYNWAILPGWQRHYPLYRYGTITALDIDNDLCWLDVDAATSTEQGINVNVWHSLSAVPIDYMDCNADAFAIGDHVLISFDGQKWEAPRVVGFAENPKECRAIWEPFNVADGLQYLHEWEIHYKWFIPDNPEVSRPSNEYFYVVRNDPVDIAGDLYEQGDKSLLTLPITRVDGSTQQSAKRDLNIDCLAGSIEDPYWENTEEFSLLWSASDDAEPLVDPSIDTNVTPWVHLKLAIYHEWESTNYYHARELTIRFNSVDSTVSDGEYGLKDYPGPNSSGSVAFHIISGVGNNALSHDYTRSNPLPGIKRYKNGRWLKYDPNVNWYPDYHVSWDPGWNYRDCADLVMKWPEYSGTFETVFDIRNYPSFTGPISTICFYWIQPTSCQWVSFYVDTIDFFETLPEEFNRTWFN